VLLFHKPAGLTASSNAPAAYADLYRKDGVSADNFTANNNTAFHQTMSFLPEFLYAYAQIGSKKYPFI
tara:strand:+ start:1045 stop:1248 length:204 start_codon:yes stop_codon:yes gene_type:complete